MLRWFLLVMLAYLAYRLLRSGVGATRSAHPQETSEHMVNCAQCSVNFPASEAVVDGDREFCSEQHHQTWMRLH